MDQPEYLNRVQQGDQQAFARLVDEWQDRVYNTALGIVQNEDDADDVTQDVFVQVFQSISSFKGEAKFSTWLYRVAISKSLDSVKKKNRKKRFGVFQSFFTNVWQEDNQPTDFNHPGVLTENREHAKVLFKALNQLPENQRIAFTLHKLEAQKHEDIAQVMRLSTQATESLIARAKANLRKILKEYYVENNF